MSELATAQLLYSTTSAPTSVTPILTVTVITEVSGIWISNTNGVARTLRLFHDSGSDVLVYIKSVENNETDIQRAPYTGGGIILGPGDSLKVRAGGENMHLSLYGQTQNVVGVQRGI
jgi:hypothetical protein